jgi:hypothetical protein
MWLTVEKRLGADDVCPVVGLVDVRIKRSIQQRFRSRWALSFAPRLENSAFGQDMLGERFDGS